MEYSYKKAATSLNRMKENLKIIINEKVAASARPIKLNGSCIVWSCVLLSSVAEGKERELSQMFWWDNKYKQYFDREFIVLKKRLFSSSNRNLLKMKNIEGVMWSHPVTLKGNVPFRTEHTAWLKALSAWHHLSLVLNTYDRHFWEHVSRKWCQGSPSALAHRLNWCSHT